MPPPPPRARAAPPSSAPLPSFSFTSSLISRSAIGGPPLCGRPAWGRRLFPFRSAAGREQSHERGGGVPPHGIVDVPLVPAARPQPRAPQHVQVMGERGAGHLHRLLDLSRRHLARRADQEEEHLEP